MLFLIGQTVTIALVIVGAAWHLGSRMSAIETKLDGERAARTRQREDIDALEKRVHGISRKVERHSTVLEFINPGDAKTKADRR